jgi:FkbM family methyltransferase
MNSAGAVLRALARQLRLSDFVRLTALFVAKRLAEPWTVFSFAQRGEDLVLDGLLRSLPHAAPLYVDVGANDPVRDSNTYRLYLRGWHGLLIDANPKAVEACARRRPRDQAVCAGVSDDLSPRAFRIPGETRLAHFVTPGEAPESDDRVVVPRALSAILDDAAFPSAFGVLSIDCEGSDLEVIRSLDLQRYHPALVVIEQAAHDPVCAGSDAIGEHLRGNGYDLVAYDGLNGYYVANGSLSGEGGAAP